MEKKRKSKTREFHFQAFKNTGKSYVKFKADFKDLWEAGEPLSPDFVIENEHAYFDHHHNNNWNRTLKYGLGISGGGIRSAAFSIGIIQALQNENILEKTSYMSTVSGGSFSGAALSWFLIKFNTFPFGHKSSFEGSQEFDPEFEDETDQKTKNKTPAQLSRLSEKALAGEKKLTPTELNLVEAIRNDDANKILSYIRQKGNYLTPHQLGKASFAARGLLSVAHSAVSYFLFIAALLFSVQALANVAATKSLWLRWGTAYNWSLSVIWDTLDLVGIHFDQIKNFLKILGNNSPSDIQIHFSAFFATTGLIFILIFVLIIFIYGVGTFLFGKETITGYRVRIKIQKILGFLLKGLIISAILVVLPGGYQALVGESFSQKDAAGIGIATVSGIIGALLAIYKFQKEIGGDNKMRGPLVSLMVNFVVLTLIFSLLTLSFVLAEFILGLKGPGVGLKIALASIGFIFPFLVDINMVSLHRVYRDRLAETFLWDHRVRADAGLSKIGGMATQAPLSSFLIKRKKQEHREPPRWVPYHLINTNVIFTNAKRPKLRGRRGDNFILSPKFCGSQATGYAPTSDFLKEKLTLATAMAASGAAVNPNAGVSGRGLTINPLLSFLMTFFGLRLGIWVPSPNIQLLKLHSKFLPPNYIWPGFFSLVSWGQHEDSKKIELTDGGHFDNTGLYELFRRRVPNIILCDGAADPKFTFDDLGNALERARVDFGVKVTFEEFKLGSLLPGSRNIGNKKGREKIIQEKLKLAERGFAMAKVQYPATEDGKQSREGRLFYFKATLIADLPADIFAYQAKNPEFPSQSTVDQFFDERQFESYRELGYRLAKPEVQKIVSHSVPGWKL